VIEQQIYAPSELGIDPEPDIDEAELAEFAERLRHNRGFLQGAAQHSLYRWYASYVFDPEPVACNCEAKLPECDCLLRFRIKNFRCALQQHKVGRPHPDRPLVSTSLYSGRNKRWWGERRFSGSKQNDDETIRSHDKSASVGMKGFNAGTRGVWKNDNAIYYPEQDDRASTRDRNRTAREGERALQKPYDDPEGTPKSWSNPADAEPDYDGHDRKIGNRVIEEGVIEPSKDGGEE
jgi:hypothetical protein